MLDVAGLVPGAHEGKGLGNKFLDDLRHADALIHVVDVSGTTDAEGKVTRGYDPSFDITWLRSESKFLLSFHFNFISFDNESSALTNRDFSCPMDSGKSESEMGLH